MDKKKINEAISRHQIEERLKSDFNGTISDRASRYLELDFIKIIPNQHFSPISTECILLYRDGYFFASIALCQAVAEALVRFMCEKSQFGASISEHFNENVELLRKRKIEPDCTELLEKIWEGRNDYHHLNLNIPNDRTKLQAIAKDKIITLHNVESTVFGFAVVKGTIVPKYRKYWDIHNGLADVFLRFEP